MYTQAPLRGHFCWICCTFHNKSTCFSKTTFISMAHLLAVFTHTVRVWYSPGCPEKMFNKKNTNVRRQKKRSFQAHGPLWKCLAGKVGHQFIKKKLNNIRRYEMAGFELGPHQFRPRPPVVPLKYRLMYRWTANLENGCKQSREGSCVATLNIRHTRWLLMRRVLLPLREC